MTEMLYCYCCRVHHPKEQMRLYPTRHGWRWRCLRSIEAAHRSQAERDAFGQMQSDMNREAKRDTTLRQNELPMHLRMQHP